MSNQETGNAHEESCRVHYYCRKCERAISWGDRKCAGCDNSLLVGFGGDLPMLLGMIMAAGIFVVLMAIGSVNSFFAIVAIIIFLLLPARKLLWGEGLEKRAAVLASISKKDGSASVREGATVDVPFELWTSPRQEKRQEASIISIVKSAAVPPDGSTAPNEATGSEGGSFSHELTTKVASLDEDERVPFLLSFSPETRAARFSTLLSDVNWHMITSFYGVDRDTSVARAVVDALVSIGELDLIAAIEEDLGGELSTDELAIVKEALINPRKRIAEANDRMLYWQDGRALISDAPAHELYSVVDSFEEVEHLSAEDPVLLRADWRCLHASTPVHEPEPEFETELLPRIWGMLQTVGGKLCWVKFHRGDWPWSPESPLAKYLKEQGLKEDSWFLFAKGKLVSTEGISDDSTYDGQVKPALNLLQDAKEKGLITSSSSGEARSESGSF